LWFLWHHLEAVGGACGTTLRLDPVPTGPLEGFAVPGAPPLTSPSAYPDLTDTRPVALDIRAAVA